MHMADLGEGIDMDVGERDINPFAASSQSAGQPTNGLKGLQLIYAVKGLNVTCKTTKRYEDWKSETG